VIADHEILLVFVNESGEIFRWEFENNGKAIEMNVDGPLIAGDQELALEGAPQGLGIIYTHNDSHIYDWIKAGRLKRVLADWSPRFPGLFIYYSSRHHTQPALRAFIDCLLARRKQRKISTRPGLLGALPNEGRVKS
jgi:DNA-binding transcriptional LysR family regulator